MVVVFGYTGRKVVAVFWFGFSQEFLGFLEPAPKLETILIHKIGTKKQKALQSKTDSSELPSANREITEILSWRQDLRNDSSQIKLDLAPQLISITNQGITF